MTPADLERVRVALEDTHPAKFVVRVTTSRDESSYFNGIGCECGNAPPGTSWELYVSHIVAVLAAQDEETE